MFSSCLLSRSFLSSYRQPLFSTPFLSHSFSSFLYNKWPLFFYICFISKHVPFLFFSFRTTSILSSSKHHLFLCLSSQTASILFILFKYPQVVSGSSALNICTSFQSFSISLHQGCRGKKLFFFLHNWHLCKKHILLFWPKAESYSSVKHF